MPPSRRRPPGAPRGRAGGGKADRKKTPGGGRGRPGGAGVAAFQFAAAAIAAAVAIAAGRTLVASARAAKKGRSLLARAAANPTHYTEHARCRMACRCVWVVAGARGMRAACGAGAAARWRDAAPPNPPPLALLDSHISEADVKDTLARGTVERAKSALDKAPCAKLVAARGRVTVVADACPADTGIITVIDTRTNWACDCP